MGANLVRGGDIFFPAALLPRWGVCLSRHLESENSVHCTLSLLARKCPVMHVDISNAGPELKADQPLSSNPAPTLGLRKFHFNARE